MDKVKISIRAVQTGPDGKAERVVQHAAGAYSLKGGKHYIRYEDKAMDKKKPVPTTIKLADKELVILRQGVVRSRQSFLLDRETRADYETPYGLMELVMRTDRLESEFAEGEGCIRLVYSLAANGAHVGRYDLEIRLAADDKGSR